MSEGYIHKVALVGASALRTKCEPCSLAEIQEEFQEEFGDKAIDGLLAEMYKTMVAENGIGLAANQICYQLRMFILKDNSRQGYREYINPEILNQEELVDFDNEGCLSIPGVTAKTKRYRKLSLRWQDREGTTHEGAFEGIQAFAVQHEIDHLDGKLYVDQFSPMVRAMVLKKHKKFLRNLGRR